MLLGSLWQMALKYLAFFHNRLRQESLAAKENDAIGGVGAGSAAGLEDDDDGAASGGGGGGGGGTGGGSGRGSKKKKKKKKNRRQSSSTASASSSVKSHRTKSIAGIVSPRYLRNSTNSPKSCQNCEK